MMNKTTNTIYFIFIAVIICFFTSCTCSHDWNTATCEYPKSCSQCGAIEGEPLGHNWVDATCTTATYCSLCKQTAGNPIGHIWIDATSSSPKTCAVCKMTEGEPLQRNVVGSYKLTYMENGSEVYDALEFFEDGTVTYYFYHKTDGFSGHCDVPGTWNQNKSTISITLKDKWFDFETKLHFEGDTSKATLTNEGLIWGFDSYKKIS